MNSNEDYFEHPLLNRNSVEYREYQEKLFDEAVGESTLVALPTGTGKTIVSLLVMAERLSDYTDGQALFLAPTKPLVEQQAEFYREALALPDEEVQILTGETRPDERDEILNRDTENRVIVATPQVVKNDLLDGRLVLDNFVHLTFDECHRATGDYAYNYIAEMYWKQAEHALVTGLSASPGSDKESVLNICENLGLTHVSVVTEDMESLSEYTYETNIEPVWVNLDDEILKIRDLVQGVYKSCLKELKDRDVLSSARKDLPMHELLSAQGNVQKRISQGDSDAYKDMSLVSQAIKVHHALEKIDTQGVYSFLSYMQGIKDETESDDSSKAAKRIMRNDDIQKALDIAEGYDDIHPKKKRLRGDAVNKVVMDDEKVLVFTKYRDTASDLVDFLDSTEALDAHKFVGQADKKNDKGMSQERQKEVLQEFRDGEHDVLVATSVGEEGLDIPQVGLVVFYEPIPSTIRNIQRRGRTGRASKGEVKIMIGKDTRDEGYYYASKQREENMKDDMKELQDVSGDINEALEESQSELTDYQDEHDVSDDGIEIIADTRETSSTVVEELNRIENVTTTIETLDVGDYIISEDCIVERKSTRDFVDTLTGGERDLFEQAKELSNNAVHPVMIIEGEIGDLYARNVHPNAIRGALVTLAMSFDIKFLHSRDESETASFLSDIAEKEQIEEEKTVSLHGDKDDTTPERQQEYIVASISGVETKRARSLLEEFGSVRSIFTASAEELTKVEGIGEKTANYIENISTREYSED